MKHCEESFVAWPSCYGSNAGKKNPCNFAEGISHLLKTYISQIRSIDKSLQHHITRSVTKLSSSILTGSVSLALRKDRSQAQGSDSPSNRRKKHGSCFFFVLDCLQLFFYSFLWGGGGGDFSIDFLLTGGCLEEGSRFGVFAPYLP